MKRPSRMPNRCALLLSLSVALACGDDAVAPAGDCEAGDTRSCELASGCEAERLCEGEPAEWSRCRCREGEQPEPDAGPPDLPRLGGACDDDDACPRGAHCLLPDASSFHGGGPPAGVCVADCTGAAAACEAFEDAVCVDVKARAAADDDRDAGAGAASALCFERCEVGSEPEDKCHAREDAACEALDEARPTDGFCRPLCATDEACGDGRSCDPRSSACVDAAPASYDSFGQRCEADAGAADCDGLCVTLDDDFAACGQRCVFGQPGDCAPLPSAAPRGGCLYTSPKGTIGDVGFCAELCDCTLDCSNPEAVCDGFTDGELERVFGRRGVCTAAELALGEALTCQ